MKKLINDHFTVVNDKSLRDTTKEICDRIEMNHGQDTIESISAIKVESANGFGFEFKISYTIVSENNTVRKNGTKK